jgi:chloramphenicol 3-O phosphotransferase
MKKPFAVYLNGTSSAGKTTIRRALQEAIEIPVLTTGIDLLIRRILPDKAFLQRSTQDDFYSVTESDSQGCAVPRLFMGERAKNAYHGLIAATVALLKTGNSVIIDDVAIAGKWQVDLWKEALSEFPSIFVGVHCSLEVLQQREKARGDRPLNSAQGQYDIVHKEIEYDLNIDTHRETLEAIVSKILSFLR